MSPESVNVNHISSMKTTNSFSKSDNNTTNNYNSCYNFYQKNNLNKKKINNINMLNTVNNFGYLNSFNSMDGSSKKVNSLYDDNGENENISSHINISQQDFRKNENNNKVKKNSNNNNLIYNNKSESVNKGHKKGKYSVNAFNLNNSNREFQLNKLFNNDYIEYQRKIIEQFCHCLEEFIFINVKNNFDYFISQLKCYGKERRFSSLLLKRLQNKTIQKNFYKERASSYKYLEPNGPNSHYSSIIMMNNSNIINVQRKGDYIPGEMTKDNYGRKTAYNFRNSRSPLTEKMNRLQKNFRNGKSQEPLDINNIENYDFYNNNTYFQNNNILENYNNFNNYNASFGRNNYININVEEDDEERKSLIKYETNFNDNNNLYVPKKV